MAALNSVSRSSRAGLTNHAVCYLVSYLQVVGNPGGETTKYHLSAWEPDFITITSKCFISLYCSLSRGILLLGFLFWPNSAGFCHRRIEADFTTVTLTFSDLNVPATIDTISYDLSIIRINSKVAAFSDSQSPLPRQIQWWIQTNPIK